MARLYLDAIGNAHDFDALYRTHYNFLRKFIVQKCWGNDSIVDDILQDTFTNALKSIASFRGDCKITTWLCAISHNVYLNHLRLAVKHRTELLETCSEAEFVEHDTLSPARIIEARDTLHHILNSGKVAESGLSYILEHELEETDYTAIAERLGIPSGTIKRRVYNARQDALAISAGK